MLVRCINRISCRPSIPAANITAAFSVNAESIVNPDILQDFRTKEINVSAQGKQHIGRFYRIPDEDKKQIFSHGGFPKSFEKQIKTFGESCVMIREPAIEILDYIKRTNFKTPVNRFIVYGESGAGKSLTLAHLLHYGYQNDFLLVHVPWVPNWFKRPKEISNSANMEGFIDLPFDAAAWLVHFKTQNAKLLSKLDLKTTRDNVWSIRESTPAGSTFTQLIEHGIARIKFASETIAALVEDIKHHATAGRCKVMVIIDGYNAFFHPVTRILSDNKSIVPPNKVTLTQSFLDITNYNWSNGVCIMSVDKIGMTEGYMESSMPRYLLGKDGFEHADPFIPIKVQDYSEKEFETCISYYMDRRWIQNQITGFDKELKFLSNQNPYKLMNICAPL